jgi:hypothetical protein
MRWNIAAAALFSAYRRPALGYGSSCEQIDLRQNQASAFDFNTFQAAVVWCTKAFKSSSLDAALIPLESWAPLAPLAIRQCLETRNFPVSKLRIFGSARSAGTVQETSAGAVTIELFDLQSARECDVVFLAVSGDFSLEHAEALVAGDDGCVVIDNSVRDVRLSFDYRKRCRYTRVIALTLTLSLMCLASAFSSPLNDIPLVVPKSMAGNQSQTCTNPTVRRLLDSWHSGPYTSCLRSRRSS